MYQIRLHTRWSALAFCAAILSSSAMAADTFEGKSFQGPSAETFTIRQVGDFAEVGRSEAEDRQDLFALQQLRQAGSMQEADGQTPASEESQSIDSSKNAFSGSIQIPMNWGKGEGKETSKLRQLLEDSSGMLGAGSEPSAYGMSGFEGGPESHRYEEALRFLRGGLEQSYGQSYEGAWNTLHRHMKRVVEIDSSALPKAVRFLLETARKASYEKSYSEAWEIIHTAVKNILDAPYDFTGPARETFPRVLRIARLCSYDKSYQDAWKVLHTFIKALDSRKELMPGEVPHLAMRLVMQGTYDNSYEHAWKMFDKGLKRIERGIQNAGHFFEVVSEVGTAGTSYEAAWKGMHTMMKGIRDRKDLFPNEQTHMALKATMKASYEKNYSEAWEVLRDGSKALQQALRHPRDYFRVALQASGGKTYADGWDILRDFAVMALDSRFLSSFDRESLRTSLESSYNRSYADAYRILRRGMENLR